MIFSCKDCHKVYKREYWFGKKSKPRIIQRHMAWCHQSSYFDSRSSIFVDQKLLDAIGKQVSRRID